MSILCANDARVVMLLSCYRYDVFEASENGGRHLGNSGDTSGAALDWTWLNHGRTSSEYPAGAAAGRLPDLLDHAGLLLVLTYRGVATGGVYRDIYPPNQSTLIFLSGCFVSLTQDKFDIVQFIPPKFDIVQFIPPQIKFLATPLLTCTAIIHYTALSEA